MLINFLYSIYIYIYSLLYFLIYPRIGDINIINISIDYQIVIKKFITFIQHIYVNL